jgi:TonB family protein
MTIGVRRGIIYSILFHLFLALVFTLVNCSLNIVPPEPIELGLSMVAEEGMFEEGGMTASAGTPDEEGTTIPVDMPDSDAPPIKDSETVDKDSEKLTEGVLDTLLSDIGETGKELDPKSSSSGEESLGVGGKKGMPYSISGALSQRKIIKQVIPQYPPGYEEITKVVVKITVEPSGEVKKLLLMNTGGEVFDRRTLEALREWRWESLPPNAEQVNQEGIITFYYELK